MYDRVQEQRRTILLIIIITLSAISIFSLLAVAERNFPFFTLPQYQKAQTQQHITTYIQKKVDPDAFITIWPDKYWWTIDPINVYIVVDKQNHQQSLKYVDDAKNAINKWSYLLKEYSGNYKAWNFKIYTLLEPLLEFNEKAVITNSLLDPSADIIIELKEDPIGEECIESGIAGYSAGHRVGGLQYSYVYTSCISDEYSHDYVYSTVLHEFAHNLGLGHAFNTAGDLMCGIDQEERQQLLLGYGGDVYEGNNSSAIKSCKSVIGKVEPSELDVKSMIYVYGHDGFKEPNIKLYETYSDRLFYVYGMRNVTSSG